VESEPQPGGHAEVAAAAADRPEQVGIGLGVDADEFAVGGDQLGGEQVVDRQAVLADQVADAAGEGDPADADRAGVAEPGRQAVGVRGGGVLPRGQARLGPGGAALWVDVQRTQVRQVEDDAPVADAVAGRAVAAAADGELQPGLARERDDAGDVRGVGGADDDRGPPVEPAVEEGAPLVVAGVVRRDHAAAQVGAELWDREGGVGGGAGHDDLPSRLRSGGRPAPVGGAHQ
jgi:hypothetical protein